MTRLPSRLSPLDDALEQLGARWGSLADMPVPLDFGDPRREPARAAIAGLCDASALARLAVKGPAARSFLSDQGLVPPEKIYDYLPADGGGLIVRTGAAEYFVEDGWDGGTVAGLAAALGPAWPGVYRVLGPDASLLLAGREAIGVLSQACGFNFRDGGGQFVMTQVAGVSCGVVERELAAGRVFQLWLDGTYGIYLWNALLEIVVEAGGGPVGAGCLFPELVGQ